jgi:hypothetical protein
MCTKAGDMWAIGGHYCTGTRDLWGNEGQYSAQRLAMWGIEGRYIPQRLATSPEWEAGMAHRSWHWTLIWRELLSPVLNSSSSSSSTFSELSEAAWETSSGVFSVLKPKEMSGAAVFGNASPDENL